MEEEKLARVMGEAIGQSQKAAMDQLAAMQNQFRQGFFVEIAPSEMASLLTKRAKELRAEIESALKSLTSAAPHLGAAAAAMPSMRGRPIDEGQLRNHFNMRMRDADRLDFLASHVIRTDDVPYRLTPDDLAHLLLEDQRMPIGAGINY